MERYNIPSTSGNQNHADDIYKNNSGHNNKSIQCFDKSSFIIRVPIVFLCLNEEIYEKVCRSNFRY